MGAKPAIAKLELVGVTPPGKRRRVLIAIGIPYAIRDGRGPDCAACPISVRGLGPGAKNLNVRRILGGDTLQALSIALAIIRRRLLDFVESGNRRLFADGQHEVPIEAYFPRYEWETNLGPKRLAEQQRTQKRSGKSPRYRRV